MSNISDLWVFIPRDIALENVVFVCVGSNKIIGDCLGPYVGSLLKNKGYEVYGTMDSPVHAMNLDQLILPKDKFVVAIDSGVSRYLYRPGDILVCKSPLKPGTGVSKTLREIGDVSIIGFTANIQCWNRFVDFADLINVPFSLVVNMSLKIVQQIDIVFNQKEFDTDIDDYGSEFVFA